MSELADLIPPQLRKKLQKQILAFLEQKQQESEIPLEFDEQAIFNEAYRIALNAIIKQLDAVTKQLAHKVKQPSKPHDHKGDVLYPNRLHPTYCSLRTAQIKEDQITDLVHDATKIQGVTVDDSAIGDGKVLKYSASSTKLEYADDDDTEYTDAEAIAAVEGEATLNLSGIVTLANDLNMGGYDINFDAPDDFIDYKASATKHYAFYLGGIEQARITVLRTLLIDTIGELTAAAGVTIDGVLLKDGGATLTNDLDVGTASKILFSDIGFRRGSASWIYLRNAADTAYKGLMMGALKATSFESNGVSNFIIKSRAIVSGVIRLDAYDVGASGWETVACAYSHATQPYFDILKGGDITMLDQKMMTLGTYTDAQRPAAGTAGRIIFNTDDGQLNVDDGTNWTLPDGTAT